MRALRLIKKLMVLSIGVICLLGTSVAFAVPYDGASVSISGAQFTFNSSNIFTTAVNGSSNGPWSSTAGPNTVYAAFFDADGNKVSSFIGATLEVTEVDFSGGLTNGSGGGFIIKNKNGVDLLSGVYGAGSSLSSSGIGAEFESSMIVSFWNSILINTEFFAPGLFSATLGDVGTLSLGQPFTTTGAATAKIESSTAPVPEPATLLLLGFGLVGLGVLGNIGSRRCQHDDTTKKRVK